MNFQAVKFQSERHEVYDVGADSQNVKASFILFFLFLQIGNSQDRVACLMKEALLRNYRFASRELHLASRLTNDQLKLENDGMENEIARLQHRGQDQNFAVITLDRFLIEQDRLAITISKSFVQVWSAIDNTGNKALQSKLDETERQFDQVDGRCHPDDLKITIDTAKANCTDFQRIKTAVLPLRINISLSPSMFRHGNTLGEKLLITDTAQLTRDRAARLLDDIKRALVNDDGMRIDLDKQLWLLEMMDIEFAKHRKAHPDENDAPTGDLFETMKTTREKIGSLQDETRRRLMEIQNSR